MNSCFYGERNEEFEDIIKHWNSKPIMKKYLGEIGGNKSEDMHSEMYINDVAEHLFRIPFNSDFNYSKGMVNRMKREINNIESNYKSGKLGTFRKYFYVADAIANKSPVTRMFYENVNLAINYERNNMDAYLSYSKSIAGHIRNALVNKGDMSKSEAKKYMKRMQELETKIMRAGTADDTNEYYREYKKLFDDHGADVINDYIALMEMDKGTYQAEKNKYPRDVRLAVEESNELLRQMGGVLINGLDRMQNVVTQIYDSPILPKSARKYIDRIKEAKKKIADGIDKGGYLPHYLLDNIVEMNYRMRGLAEAKNISSKDQAMENLISRIETMVPNQARSRNELLNNIWAKNPFFILTQYSKDVIAFNKINFIQEQYIPAMRRMQKEDTSLEFVRDMRDYIEDTFQVATHGLMERPDWVNGTVRAIMAIETLKSMGLSVTGAIRNGASAAYFFTQNGLLSAGRAIGKYNSHYQGILGEIEAEQGFKFSEAGRELVAEGLIPSEGVNVSDIKYDPLTNSVSYRDKGILKKLDPLIDKTVGKSLLFHRFTENATRKWMFRIAWVEAFETLKGHNIVDQKSYKDAEVADKANTKALERMATRFAVKAVNSFAFEYAAHAKASAIGGTAPRSTELTADGKPKMQSRDYATALGEVAFQFLHYPMSFLNLQSKIAKGAYDAALSGQWDAPELKQALRFAGIYMAVQSLSIATNLDLTNTLENDTVERLKELTEYFTADEKDLKGRKRGMVNDFTGPIVGDMLYALNMFQMYKMPDEEWAKMLTGYIDYYAEGDVPDWVNPKKKIDTEEKRNMWNRLNVELARFRTKNWPAIRDGRGIDIFRHELGWYPRSHIKEKRKWVNKYAQRYLGFKPFTIKKGKRFKKGGGLNKKGEEALRRLILEMENR
jgi:polyhydroxyalkanoate synthesis regulator phasin